MERVDHRLIVWARDALSGHDQSTRIAAQQLAERFALYDAIVFRALDRLFRSRRAHQVADVPLRALAKLWRGRVRAFQVDSSALCCLSMQRDGHVREGVLHALRSTPGRAALAAVINRMADPVESVAHTAQQVLEARLADETISDLVWCLPLVDAVASTHRGGLSALVQVVDQRLAQDRVELRCCLTQAVQAESKEMRRCALERLVAMDEDPAGVLDWLTLGLSDSSPAIRQWAGGTALRRFRGARLDGLLSLIGAVRSPALRLLALQEHRRRGDEASLLRFCFDGNANVRFYARRYLRRYDKNVDFRSLALGVLEDVRSRPKAIYGALSVLSEHGRPHDRGQIERYVTDQPARIVREAHRTLAMIGVPDNVRKTYRE